MQGAKVPAENEIRQHFPLVSFVVRRYLQAAEYDDLFQVGCIGLLKAARNFDPSRGAKFSTYAILRISYEIRNHLRSIGFIKVSRAAAALLHNIRRAGLTERPPQAIAEFFQCDAELAQLALELDGLQVCSIHRPVFTDEEDTTLEDTLPAHDDDTAVYMQEFRGSLTEREKAILALRMQGKPQREISEKTGISQVSVSRILRKIGEKFEIYLSDAVND